MIPFVFLGNTLAHLFEVSIRHTDTQPDSPIKLRRDQRRAFVASFNLGNIRSGQASFHWRVEKLTLSPFNISDTPELLVHTTREFNIVPKLLSTGLKLVVFELQVTRIEVPARESKGRRLPVTWPLTPETNFDPVPVMSGRLHRVMLV